MFGGYRLLNHDIHMDLEEFKDHCCLDIYGIVLCDLMFDLDLVGVRSLFLVS